MAYPFTWEKIEGPESVIHPCNTIKCKEDGLITPETFDTMGINRRIYNFEVRDDDIFLITFPRSGTTWIQELIWGLTSGIDPDVKDMKILIRSPLLERDMISSSLGIPEIGTSYEGKSLKERSWNNCLDYTSRLKSPRVIKTHLPLSHLPPDLLKNAKVVYLARDPRDVLVSTYHHINNFNILVNKTGITLKEFFPHYQNGSFFYGDWFKHVNDHWQFRDNENFYFIWYEEFKENIEKAFDGLQAFLGYRLEDDKKKELMDRSSIESMRERNVGSYANDGQESFLTRFYRKGITRDWMNHFTTQEEREQIDNWMRNGLKGTDIILYDDYEI